MLQQYFPSSRASVSGLYVLFSKILKNCWLPLIFVRAALICLLFKDKNKKPKKNYTQLDDFINKPNRLRCIKTKLLRKVKLIINKKNIKIKTQQHIFQICQDSLCIAQQTIYIFFWRTIFIRKELNSSLHSAFLACQRYFFMHTPFLTNLLFRDITATFFAATESLQDGTLLCSGRGSLPSD